MLHEATIRGVGVSVGEDGMGAPAVALEARGEIVPILVGGGQARTIERARQGVPAERPMTHDLFVGVLDDVGVRIERVRIDDLADGTFYAKLDLAVARDGETGTEEVVRDTRPSDGIALAVRVDCPVLVADEVIDDAGRPPESLALEGGSSGRNAPGPDRGPGRGAGPVGGSEPPESSEEENVSLDPDDAVEIDIEDSGDEDSGDEDGDDDHDDRAGSPAPDS